MNAPAKPANNEMLSIGQRVGEIISEVFILLVFAFFLAHQSRDTGFFTAAFGPWEQLCLYVPLVLSMAAPLVRAALGRRNPARPFEIVTYALLAIGSFWLLLVFPFNFTHLADVLPAGLRFVLAWVPDWMGKVVLGLQVAVGLVMVAVTTGQYYAARQRSGRAS